MTTLRVATYNLYLGADMSVVFGVGNVEELQMRARVVLEQVLATDFPSRAAAVARILVREQVDLVGLQEVAEWSRVVADDGDRSEVWLDFLDELVDALARQGAAYDVTACRVSFAGGAHLSGGDAMAVRGHNAVLVRRGRGIEVTSERTGDFARALAVPTGIPDLDLTITRGWGWVDLHVDGKPLRFVNTHLEAWDEATRNAQRDELLAEVGDPGVPVVVVGDFNATPELVGMPAEYVDAWAVAGEGGAGLTCGRSAGLADDKPLDVRIDYVWVRGASVVGSRVVGASPEDRTPAGLWPSDHAGVLADIVL